MKRVPVSDTFALVDDEDYERIMANGPWHLSHGYAQHGCHLTNGRRASIYMHRAILSLSPGDPDVDHVNHNQLDNRRNNLRICMPHENLRNARARKTYAGHRVSSHFKGVCRKSSPIRWRARIVVNNTVVALGVYADEITAARAYDSAAAHFFGEFACLNLPNEIPSPYPFRKETKVTSSYRGVCYEKHQTSRNKWRAELWPQGKRVYLGSHLTEAEAVSACETYLREHGLPSRLL